MGNAVSRTFWVLFKPRKRVWRQTILVMFVAAKATFGPTGLTSQVISLDLDDAYDSAGRDRMVLHGVRAPW